MILACPRHGEIKPPMPIPIIERDIILCPWCRRPMLPKQEQK